MDGSVADIGHRQQHIVWKFTLNARAPHLNIRIGTRIFGKLVQRSGAIEGGGTECGQRRRTEWLIIPDAVSRNVVAVGVHLYLPC